MKHVLKFILLALTIVCTMACENKWPDNGDFDGMWQLMSIERDGVVTSLKETKHYWSVRTKLVQYTEYGNSDRKYSHFERRDGKLILTDFCYNWGNSENNKNNEWIKSTPADERLVLAPWGVFPEDDKQHPDRLTQTFTIDHLDYDNLILSTPSYRLVFRKF